MKGIASFESALSSRHRRIFRSLTSPEKIQEFVDSIVYFEDDAYHCPLKTMRSGKGCCFEGALLAAAALGRRGLKPLIITLIANDDDDHVLALYKRSGCWGAIAKSRYPGLRSRQPVYRTLRELVLSYFEFYFNPRGKRTLREYSVPLDLERFDTENWLENDETASRISDALDATRHLRLISSRQGASLANVDKWLFDAEMRCGARPKKAW